MTSTTVRSNERHERADSRAMTAAASSRPTERTRREEVATTPRVSRGTRLVG